MEKGKWYTYMAPVWWLEDGKWVGQVYTFDIRASDIHHVEVAPSTAPAVEREITVRLALRPAADRKAAESREYCAVVDGCPREGHARREGRVPLPQRVRGRRACVKLLDVLTMKACAETCKKLATSCRDMGKMVVQDHDKK